MAETRRDIQKRAFLFACTIVRFCDVVSDPRSSTRHLVQQLLKAGTSIGANLEEAAAGQTKPRLHRKNLRLPEGSAGGGTG